MKVLIAQSRLTLCNPMDCSPSGFSVYGILQARILEWVAISSSRESSWSRDRTRVSCTAGRFSTIWATREAQFYIGVLLFSCSVMSVSLQPYGLQDSRLPCPSPTPGSLLKLMSVESVMPSNHFILCHPPFLPPSIFPSIRVSSNKSVLPIR